MFLIISILLLINISSQCNAFQRNSLNPVVNIRRFYNNRNVLDLHLKTSSSTIFDRATCKETTNSNFKCDRNNKALRALPIPVETIKDVGVVVLSLAIGTVFFNILVFLKSKFFSSKVSRKLAHIGSGPLFLLTWPLYSSINTAKYTASLLPLIAIALIVVSGKGTTKKTERIVDIVSRSGDKSEVLRGPLTYTIVLLIASLFFFRTSPEGIFITLQVAVGDGLADLVGRKWGSVKWPYSANKSIIGTMAFVFGSFLATILALLYFTRFGYSGLLGTASSVFDASLILKLFGISLVCGLVETLPESCGDDNINVALTAGLLSHYLVK